MPKVTVDGQEIEVPAGAAVLQACELARMEIPSSYKHESKTHDTQCGEGIGWMRRIHEHNAQFAEAAE